MNSEWTKNFHFLVLNSGLVIYHVRMDLLVRAAFKVVPLELAMSIFFFFGLSFLSGPP